MKRHASHFILICLWLGLCLSTALCLLSCDSTVETRSANEDSLLRIENDDTLFSVAPGWGDDVAFYNSTPDFVRELFVKISSPKIILLDCSPTKSQKQINLALKLTIKMPENAIVYEVGEDRNYSHVVWWNGELWYQVMKSEDGNDWQPREELKMGKYFFERYEEENLSLSFAPGSIYRIDIGVKVREAIGHAAFEFETWFNFANAFRVTGDRIELRYMQRLKKIYFDLRRSKLD